MQKHPGRSPLRFQPGGRVMDGQLAETVAALANAGEKTDKVKGCMLVKAFPQYLLSWQKRSVYRNGGAATRSVHPGGRQTGGKATLLSVGY